jgi:hypothetical protein
MRCSLSTAGAGLADRQIGGIPGMEGPGAAPPWTGLKGVETMGIRTVDHDAMTR